MLHNQPLKIHTLGNKQACAAEMAVRHAALGACRKVHVCHCNSLGGATAIMGRADGQTDRQTDRQTECDAICGPFLGRRAA